MLFIVGLGHVIATSATRVQAFSLGYVQNVLL